MSETDDTSEGTHMKLMRSLAIAALATLLLSACASGAQKDSSKGSSGASKEASGLSSAEVSAAVETEDTEVEPEPVIVEEEDGSKTTYTGVGLLPPNFPDDVPVHVSALVQSSVNGTGEENPGLVVGFDASDPPATVFAWYRQELAKRGWKIETAVVNADGGLLVASKDSRTISIAVGAGSTVATKFTITVEGASGD